LGSSGGAISRSRIDTTSRIYETSVRIETGREGTTFSPQIADFP
jgi:hypothetical protein